MVMTTRSRNHHFLAKFLLERFRPNGSKMLYYRRSTGWREGDSGPKRLGCETHLYSPGVIDLGGRAPTDDGAEQWLAKSIDTPAAGPIRRLSDGADVNSLSIAERRAIANFVGILDMRSPLVRDLVSPAMGAGVSAATDRRTTRKQLLTTRGIRVTLGEVSRIRRMMNIDCQGKPGWLHYMQSEYPNASRNVLARNWSLVHAAGGSEFVTSDLGMVKSIAGFQQPVSWEMGDIAGRVEWLVPLSPKAALLVTPRAVASALSTDPASMAAINRQFAADAREFIYARSSVAPSVFDALPKQPSDPRETRAMLVRMAVEARRSAV